MYDTFQGLPLIHSTVQSTVKKVMLCYAMRCRVRNGWKGIALLSGFSLVGLVSLGELINWTPLTHAPLALVLSSWPPLVACRLSLDPCSVSLSLCKLLLYDTQVRQCTLAHSPIVLVRRLIPPKNAANGLAFGLHSTKTPRYHFQQGPVGSAGFVSSLVLVPPVLSSLYEYPSVQV